MSKIKNTTDIKSTVDTTITQPMAKYQLNIHSSFNSSLDSKFYTEPSKNISANLLAFANSAINRHETVANLNKIFYNQHISENIEKGIYEFALVDTTKNNLMIQFVVSTYKDKVRDIINNVNGDPHVNNQTLKSSILEGHINPRLVAFLTPQQLHPKRWESILRKQHKRIETENNLATTDLYTCKKCGEKKFKLTEFQTRGADEPTTKFLTCMVCYTTFTK
jgi:DNA-directed RNA polymerase subunit M/transcription elongation factor TFIIS